ncbi:MAG: SPFH domain-containing protein [Chloroflexota bacterium]
MMPEKKRAAAAEIFRQQNNIIEDAVVPSPAPMPPPQTEIEAAEEMPEWLNASVQNADYDDDFALDEERAPNQLRRRSNRARPPTPPQMQAAAPAPRPTPQRKVQQPMSDVSSAFKSSEELQLERGEIPVRETGFLWFRRVIVPPNVYVVHTRIGRDDPVTIGLGVSFRYNPATDAYLVVPAAMQTIGIVSNCISQEKQGINVLAYVQWQISDFSVAYRKLDFSDTNDPLAVVNAQLREQADAAIKDKIATMPVSEVLTDKAPIIEELTRRLIEVTEGRLQRGSDDAASGLGISIVTVQIKEALVSSQRLWEHLQAPFRHEQERNAQLSYLEMQAEIQRREREAREITETSEAETRVNIARVQQAKQTEEQEIRVEEQEKRSEREQAAKLTQLQRQQEIELEQARSASETKLQLEAVANDEKLRAATEQQRLTAQMINVERERLAGETELGRLQHEYELLTQQQANEMKIAHLQAEIEETRQRAVAQADLDQLTLETERVRAEQDAILARLQQEVENLATENALIGRLLEQLPTLAESMPRADHMTVLQTGDTSNSLTSFIAQQAAVIKQLRDVLAPPASDEEAG